MAMLLGLALRIRMLGHGEERSRLRTRRVGDRVRHAWTFDDMFSTFALESTHAATCGHSHGPQRAVSQPSLRCGCGGAPAPS